MIAGTKNAEPAPPNSNSAQRRPPFDAPAPPKLTLGVLKRQAHCALRHSSAATRGAARPARRGRDSTPRIFENILCTIGLFGIHARR